MDDARMSFLRDTRIPGYALLIERLRRRTTVYRRVTDPNPSDMSGSYRRMEPSERELLLEKVGAYQHSMTSGSMERGPAGSLASTGDAMREWRNQDFARIESMAEANRKFWKPDKPAA